MIRRFEEKDISSVMQIWLDSNLEAHSFIAESYWRNKYEAVEKMILKAEIYVSEDSDGINGFIGLIDNCRSICKKGKTLKGNRKTAY